MGLIITFMTVLAMSLAIVEPPAIAATEAAELMVLYSNNVNGETEPCG
jgi:hypothetical protein